VAGILILTRKTIVINMRIANPMPFNKYFAWSVVPKTGKKTEMRVRANIHSFPLIPTSKKNTIMAPHDNKHPINSMVFPSPPKYIF